MAGYLDSYGVSDAKRERGVKRVVIAAVAVVLLSLAGYFFLHDFQEKRQISKFLDLLKDKKYEDAYRLWGCDPAKPCRDYNLQKFLEDWGPKSAHADITVASIRRTRSCDGGVIQILQFPKEEVLLYVDRKDRNLSFSPFEYCVDATGRNTKFLDIFFK